MRLFYPDFAAMPRQDWPAATRFLTEFLAAGRPEPAAGTPRLMDWQQDAPLIAAGISRVAGQDVRALPYLHWWSFSAGSTHRRGHLCHGGGHPGQAAPGQEAGAWELDFYRTHRAAVDLRPAPDPAADAEKQRLLARLGA